MSAFVSYQRAAGEIVFSLEGEIDLANAVEVGEEIREALDDESNVVVDLSRTEYLDSAGLRMLFALARTLGERLRVVIPEGSHLRRVVTMVGLPEVVTVVSRPDR